jgi:hypothetical protein
MCRNKDFINNHCSSGGCNILFRLCISVFFSKYTLHVLSSPSLEFCQYAAAVSLCKITYVRDEENKYNNGIMLWMYSVVGF